MRVTCHSLEEFIECLKEEDNLLQGVVRVSIVRRPLNEKNPREASIFAVSLQASAVVIIDSDSQYLLDVGIDCGVDYEDSTQEKNGTEKADGMKDLLRVYAESRGWKVLPGVIGI